MTSSFRELIPDVFVELKEANNWRVEPFDHGFIIDFGTWEGSETVRVHARIRIPDDSIENFVVSVASLAINYCEQMGIELNYIKPSNDSGGELSESQGEAEDK